MKKMLVTTLALAMMMFSSTVTFATEATPDTFVCPNGNTTCISNGVCVNNGECQYPEGCPNGGVPKRDGTGHMNGGRGMGRGRHCTQ